MTSISDLFFTIAVGFISLWAVGFVFSAIVASINATLEIMDEATRVRSLYE